MEPENIMFAGTSVQLSARKILQVGAVKGLRRDSAPHNE